MKKILLILILWCGFAQAQTPPGYTLINARYEWLAGIFKGLGLPSGATPGFSAGQAVRDGAVFCDTVESAGSPRGLYIYTDGVWILQGTPTNSVLPNALLAGGSVTYSGTGLLFSVEAAVYRINNQIYSSDSGSFTLPASDPDFDRFSRVYLGTDNAFHVLNGTPAIPAQIPQVQGDEFPLTEIMVRAAATAPDITQTIIYDENTESVVTNSGTTTDPDNATNVFQGAKSTNITNINNGDQIFFTTDGTPTTWSLTNVDALAIHIKLKAQMPTLATFWVGLFNGTSAVSSEVAVAVNKNNATTYQAISIPMSAFGTITNYNITRVRFRFQSNNANNYLGYYIDYMYLVDGIVQSGGGAGVSQISLTMPSAFTVTGSPGTGAVSLTVNGAGNSGQYVNGLGTLTAFPDLLTDMGPVDGRAKVDEGATIDLPSLYLQTVDYTFPGLATPQMKMKWDSAYYIRNLSSLGDSLIRPVNDSTTGVKGLVAGTGITLTDTDSTIKIDATAAASRFGVSGEDATATQHRIFEITDAFQFTLRQTGATTTQALQFPDDQNVRLTSDGASVNVGGGVGVTLTGPIFTVEALVDPPGTTNKMMVWDSTDARWYVTAIPSAGGSGTVNAGAANRLAYYPAAATTVDDLAAITASKVLVSDANGLPVAANPSTTEINHVAGVTSAIQTQIDSKLGHTTTDPAHTGTNPSGTGTFPLDFDIYVRADETLANSSADQNLFTNTAHDVITVQANTTYEFWGTFDFTHGAVSHSIAFGLTPTTAVVTNIAYDAWVWITAVGTTTASQNATRVKSTATTAVNSAGANGTETLEIRHGWITIGATGGTLTPQIKFSADPTGTVLLKVGSDFHIKAKGNDTFTEKGPIN